jgi:hypothetical protein
VNRYSRTSGWSALIVALLGVGVLLTPLPMVTPLAMTKGYLGLTVPSLGI